MIRNCHAFLKAKSRGEEAKMKTWPGHGRGRPLDNKVWNPIIYSPSRHRAAANDQFYRHPPFGNPKQCPTFIFQFGLPLLISLSLLRLVRVLAVSCSPGDMSVKQPRC